MKKIIFLVIIFILFAPIAFSQTRESALQAIKEAESTIEEMKNLGLKITYANDTLTEAKMMFLKGNYLAAESLAKYVKVIKEKAIKVNNLIDKAESKIYDAEQKGIDTSKAKELFDEGIEAFEKEDYESAEKLLLNAINEIEEREKELVVSRLGIQERIREMRNFIYSNLPYLLLGILFSLVSAFWGYKKLRIHNLRKRIKLLKKEKKTLEKLLKNLQERYFIKKSISKKDYESVSTRYIKNLLKVKKDIKTLESLLKKR